MRRAQACTSSSGLQTWMEIYWLHDEARLDETGQDEVRLDEAALRQMIEARAGAAGILDLVDGDRHYELFESCA